MEGQFPNLYPGDLDQVFIRHDDASLHTFRKTVPYAEDLRFRFVITITSHKGIRVKSPDTSPIDFYAFNMPVQKFILGA